MRPSPNESVAVTGMGVVCSMARTVAEFETGLREGRCGISLMGAAESRSVHVGGILRDFSWQDSFDSLAQDHPPIRSRARKALNNTTDSTRLSACAAMQALHDAQLGDGSKSLDDTGLIVAGSNLSQEYVTKNWTQFQQSGRMNPRYAVSFFDTNQVGCLSGIFAIRGTGCTMGAASASGNAALFNAFHWIRSGMMERCVVVGACTEFSEMELEAFAVLGAACTGKFRKDPVHACRPFDREHEGFVWGQASACVVLESPGSARNRGVRVHGELVGASLLLDGNHLPDPDAEGEARAMRAALNQAGLAPGQIGYINAHGTSSPLGDRTECEAIQAVFRDHLGGVWINSTKSLTGHCMSAAGVLELTACLIQMNRHFLHPNLNLETPIDPGLRFAGARSAPLDAEYALSNGFGFGGINSSLVIRRGKS